MIMIGVVFSQLFFVFVVMAATAAAGVSALEGVGQRSREAFGCEGGGGGGGVMSV